MLTLIVEDGTGRANANSYASAVDGDAYHDGHLYATAWTGATSGDKEKALAMATRLIDSQFLFKGWKSSTTQALQWPRRFCPDPDNLDSVVPGLLLARGPFLNESKVPAAVVSSTCEMARELLKTDRTDDPDGEGLQSLRIEGALSLEFNSRDRQPAVTRIVQTTLAKVGEYIGQGGTSAKLVRV